jgi:hypothetical protein
MARKRLILAGLVAIIVIVGAILIWRATHPPLSDKEQIEQILDRIEKGVETKNPSAILSTISDDYRDSFGFTKLDIHRLSLSLPRMHGTPRVVLADVQIAIRGKRATVNLSGEVTVRFGGEQTQEFAGALTLELRKNGAWHVISTNGWQGRVEQGFEE